MENDSFYFSCSLHDRTGTLSDNTNSYVDETPAFLYTILGIKRNQLGILPVWLYLAIIFCTSRRTADNPLNRPAERKIRPAQLDKSHMGQQIALRKTAVISYQKDKAVPGRYFYSENQGK